MRTNTGMTLYNRYVVSGSEYYQRTQISAVEWENVKAANVIKSGLFEADSAVIYIPLSVGADYVKPRAWQALLSKVSRWTLAVGDVLVKGLVLDEITTSFTVSALKAKYDDVVTVKSVDTMDGGSVSLRHWQISGS